eukprot:scaffold69_cov248-Pinguiococcus_pyrenoidosus.AAC.65
MLDARALRHLQRAAPWSGDCSSKREKEVEKDLASPNADAEDPAPSAPLALPTSKLCIPRRRVASNFVDVVGVRLRMKRHSRTRTAEKAEGSSYERHFFKQLSASPKASLALRLCVSLSLCLSPPPWRNDARGRRLLSSLFIARRVGGGATSALVYP